MNGGINMKRKFIIASAFLVVSAAWAVHAAVNCTATGAGRFAEPSDTTCKNYTLCVFVNSKNIYLSYNYTCPTTSIFSPIISKCTASGNYVCNVTKSNTTSSAVCTEDGYIPDPSSTNCSSYINCVKINDTFIQTTLKCPDDSFFNPNSTLCEFNYNCTTIKTKFSCTSAGRFANSTDTSCKTYYLCVVAKKGTLIPYGYTCPTISVFSPTTKHCTTSYICPGK